MFSNLSFLSTSARPRLSIAGSLALAALMAATQVVAQEAPSGKVWGTSGAPTAANVPARQALGTIQPAAAIADEMTADAVTSHLTYSSASYATGGGALRNRATTAIEISGAVAPIKAAYLYWAVITGSTAPDSVAELTLTREYPAPVESSLVKGVLIATGSVPCWIGEKINVYRALVSTALVKGNGSYRVTISGTAGTAGSVDGGDPWVEKQALPLWEGASIVVVGTGAGTVVLYDVGLAGKTWKTSLSYTLDLPVVSKGKLTLFDTIAADGQLGSSRSPIDALKYTEMNDYRVQGPGSYYNDTGWNGAAGWPLPQLWDDNGNNVTGVAPSGTKTIAVYIYQETDTEYEDCLTPVANVLEIQ